MQDSRLHMALFDDHVGIWCGTHMVIDSHGREKDRFEATVMCRREGLRWVQTTTRAWPDGRVAESEFFGTFDTAGVLHYEHPHVLGEGREVGGRDIISIWHDPDEPDIRYAAIITLLSQDRRIRTVQKIQGDKLVARILISEARVP